VADYVLGGYGSGAIMAVPGHDSRDWEFAQAFGLPVKQVVAAEEDGSTAVSAAPDEAFTAPGVAVNSTSEASGLRLDGLPTAEAKAAAIAWLEERGLGSRQVNFKLRDWLFARQRYWGEPFPIVYPEGSEVRALWGREVRRPTCDRLPACVPGARLHVTQRPRFCC
jgi:leucyl-tRNA synthetase